MSADPRPPRTQSTRRIPCNCDGTSKGVGLVHGTGAAGCVWAWPDRVGGPDWKGDPTVFEGSYVSTPVSP